MFRNRVLSILILTSVVNTYPVWANSSLSNEAGLRDLSSSFSWLRNCSIAVDCQKQFITPAGTGQSRILCKYQRDDDQAELVLAESTSSVPLSLAKLTNDTLPSYDLYCRAVTTPTGYLSYWHSANNADPKVIVDSVKDSERLSMARLDGFTSCMRGVMPRDDQRLDEVLAAARQTTVQRSTVVGDPPGCYILTCDTVAGKYTVCIDPSRGGNLLRVHIERGPLSLIRGRPLYEYDRLGNSESSAPVDSGDMRIKEVCDIDDVALSQRDGSWYPTTMRVRTTHINSLGEQSQMDLILACVQIDLHLKADLNLTINVPDGVPVIKRSGDVIDGVPRVWQNGKPDVVVDKKGLANLDSALDTAAVNLQPAAQEEGSSLPLVITIGIPAVICAVIIFVCFIFRVKGSPSKQEDHHD